MMSSLSFPPFLPPGVGERTAVPFFFLHISAFLFPVPPPLPPCSRHERISVTLFPTLPPSPAQKRGLPSLSFFPCPGLLSSFSHRERSGVSLPSLFSPFFPDKKGKGGFFSSLLFPSLLRLSVFVFAPPSPPPLIDKDQIRCVPFFPRRKEVVLFFLSGISHLIFLRRRAGGDFPLFFLLQTGGRATRFVFVFLFRFRGKRASLSFSPSPLFSDRISSFPFFPLPWDLLGLDLSVER